MSRKFKRISVLIISTIFILITSVNSLASAKSQLLIDQDAPNDTKITQFVKEFIDGRLNKFLLKNSDLNSFKELYNNDLSNYIIPDKISHLKDKGDKFQELQLKFGKRLRDAKKVIGRDYFKNETTIDITSINKLEDNVIEVKFIETTKLYFKIYDGSSEYESYSDDHILDLIKVNNKYMVINEDIPNSLISQDFTNVNGKDDKKDLTSSFNTKISTNSAQINTMSTLSSLSYNRDAAKTYADNYYQNYNWYYRDFGNDCTNFVSQCINAGFNGTQDTSGNNKWFYTWPGQILNIGYSASWDSAPDSINYWNNCQWNTSYYYQSFSTAPTNWTTLPSTDLIWNYALNGNPVYYHWDTSEPTYYHHAAIITGKTGTLDDFGNLVTWRPSVNSHTSSRYHVDYTLYPYLDYQTLINQGVTPALGIVNIPDWSPID